MRRQIGTFHGRDVYWTHDGLAIEMDFSYLVALDLEMIENIRKQVGGYYA